LAQTIPTLFFVQNVNPTLLTSEQNTRLSKYQVKYPSDVISFIEVIDLSAQQSSGWFNLNIPGKSCTALLKVKNVESSSNGDFSWYAEVASDTLLSSSTLNCFDGSVSLVRQNNILIGSIHLDDDNYEIRDLGNNVRILLKQDTSNNLNSCGVPDIPLLGDATVENRDVNPNCPVVVLMLFTPEALKADPNVKEVAKMVIAQTNQAFRNSKIRGDIKLIQAGEAKQIEFVETFSMKDDNISLIDNALLKQERDLAKADIVVVVCKRLDLDYGGWAGTLTLEPEKAVCLVDVGLATTAFTGSHEIGHIFGCHHLGDLSGTQYSRGYKFKIGNFPNKPIRYTLLANKLKGNVLHYSNPDAYYSGSKTGNVNNADNARRIDEEACFVAAFRDAGTFEPSFTVKLNALHPYCFCETTAIGACIEGGGVNQFPFTFEWRLSQNGFNYGPIYSTSSTIQIEMPCDIGESVYVQLIATSFLGEQFKIQKQYISEDGPLCSERSQKTSGSEKINNQRNLILAPNPTSGDLHFTFVPESDDAIKIQLFDFQNRLIFEQREVVSKNKIFEKNLNLDKIPSGIYLLSLNGLHFNVSKAFTKI
jgi:hypothetical protein